MTAAPAPWPEFPPRDDDRWNVRVETRCWTHTYANLDFASVRTIFDTYMDDGDLMAFQITLDRHTGES